MEIHESIILCRCAADTARRVSSQDGWLSTLPTTLAAAIYIQTLFLSERNDSITCVKKQLRCLA
eukprot:COSAG01_NODE_6220_length_3784_cov_1.767707_2_plen_64_part_00